MATTYVSIDKIETKPQVRTVWEQSALEELSASVKEYGILEPLVVRSKSGKDSGYILEIGRRRLEAAKMAGLKKVPVTVTKEPVANTPVIQLIENLQREDMNDMDLANAFKGVMETQSLTLDQLAEKISKTKGFVKQRLTLTKAAPEVQEAVRRGDIEFSGARALCGLPKEEQANALQEAVAEEAEARKDRDERKAKMLDLPGVVRAESGETSDEEEKGEAKGEANADSEDKQRKQRVSKKKTEPKAKTSTVKRITRRRKRDKAGAQTTARPVAERLEEKTKEWVAGFIDEDTKGKGLDEQLSAQSARNLLKRFTAYLLEQRALMVR
jgi:ParB family chromosome partitioning protein